MDESDSMSPIVDPESQEHRVNLMRAAAKSRDFIRSLQAAAANHRDLLIAQRGPGELVGEMALFSKSLTRCATVRCATKVTARIITHEQLVEFLMQQPMAKHQIREKIWKKESEITMVEALVKLANVHDIISASLEAVGLVPPAMSGQLYHLQQHQVVQMMRQQQQMQMQQQMQQQQQMQMQHR